MNCCARASYAWKPLEPLPLRRGRLDITSTLGLCSRRAGLTPGESLSGRIEGEFYQRTWKMARADSVKSAVA